MNEKHRIHLIRFLSRFIDNNILDMNPIMYLFISIKNPIFLFLGSIDMDIYLVIESHT
uniref:Uncharacterized protein n=1 Tax=Nelumbo nucifera TaxID=4432 RepID=A0A822ZHY0_NELNU|nr:TPA_asm: hypothetical protein HUJ06_001209 [Nelumbo nucifera]